MALLLRSGIEFGSAGVGGTISALGHGEFAGIVTATSLDASIAFWTLGASGTDHYTFTGPGDLSGDTDPDLQLIRGQKYIFKNRSGGHPFRIQSDPNGSSGTQYNDGVTNNDAGNGTDLMMFRLMHLQFFIISVPLMEIWEDLSTLEVVQETM